MKEKKGFFITNPEKANSKVAINGVMLASIFVMMAVVFLEIEKFEVIAVAEMVLSIPLLFISSLAYSKVGYLKRTKLWNSLGYFTTTLGNYFLINAIGITSHKLSFTFAYVYFGLIIFLTLAYSIINIINTKQFGKQIFKFLFALVILLLGGVLPLIFLV